MGRKTVKIAPSPWDFVTPPEEDQAMAIGNMQKKFGKDHACGSGDMLADRQTDKQTDTQTDVLITILCHRSHG